MTDASTMGPTLPVCAPAAVGAERAGATTTPIPSGAGVPAKTGCSSAGAADIPTCAFAVVAIEINPSTSDAIKPDVLRMTYPPCIQLSLLL